MNVVCFVFEFCCLFGFGFVGLLFFFFLSPTETFPVTSRIGSWPVEVLNPNIYQYAINAFKSGFPLLWKRHCSHLTLEILKMLGLSPKFYVQEGHIWRLLTEAIFLFFLFL